MLGKAMLATMLAFFVMQVGYIRYFQIYSGDRQGTGTKVQMASGSPVSGNLVKYDANGNVVDAGVQPSASGVPAGLIGFFQGACPSGWYPYTALEGRYVVGVPSGGLIGLTQGTPLANGEARAAGLHDHVVDDFGHTHQVTVPNGYFSTFTVGGYEKITLSGGALTHGYSSTIVSDNSRSNISLSASGVSTTPAPYIQLRACYKQ